MCQNKTTANMVVFMLVSLETNMKPGYQDILNRQTHTHTSGKRASFRERVLNGLWLKIKQEGQAAGMLVHVSTYRSACAMLDFRFFEFAAAKEFGWKVLRAVLSEPFSGGRGTGPRGARRPWALEVLFSAPFFLVLEQGRLGRTRNPKPETRSPGLR